MNERGRAAAGASAEALVAEESPLTFWTADACKCIGRESWLWNRNETVAEKCDELERARSFAHGWNGESPRVQAEIGQKGSPDLPEYGA